MNIAVKILSGSSFGQSIEFDLSQLWVGMESGELIFSGERSAADLAQIYKTPDGWFFAPLDGNWRIENFGIKEKVRLKSGNVISNEAGNRFEFVIGKSFSIPGEIDSKPGSQPSANLSDSTKAESDTSSEPQPSPPVQNQPAIDSTPSNPNVTPNTGEWTRNPVIIGGSVLAALLIGFVLWSVFSDAGKNQEKLADNSSDSETQTEDVEDQKKDKGSNQTGSQFDAKALPRNAVVWIGAKVESLLVPFCTAIRINRSQVVLPARFLEVIERQQSKDFYVFFDEGLEAKIIRTEFPGDYQKQSKKMQRWNFGFAHFTPPSGLSNPTVVSIPKKVLTKQDLMNDYRFSVLGYQFSKSELENKSFSSLLKPPLKTSILRVDKISPEINGIPVIEVSGELDGFFGAAIVDEQGKWCGIYDDFFFFTDQKDF